MFDPENPGEYVQFCEYCEVLLSLLKEQLTNDGILLFSHDLMKLDKLKQFVEYSLNNRKIKKIFILQQDEIGKKKTKAKKLLEKIANQKITNSNLKELIDTNKFEYNVLYEIFKDKYY